MTEEEKKILRNYLIQRSITKKIDELWEQFPLGMMTANQVGEAFGRNNNSVWRSMIVAPLKVYKMPGYTRKYYRIEDVVIRMFELEDLEINAKETED